MGVAGGHRKSRWRPSVLPMVASVCSGTLATGDVAGRSTVLFGPWLTYSRFRVIVPLWDRTMPSVMMALDRALRAFGGAPTYALTDKRADGLGRSHLRGGGPQPADRVRGPPLRADDSDLRSGRPGARGLVGGDGPVVRADRFRPSTTCAANPTASASSRPRARICATASTSASIGSRAACRR
jgi:hypothetical protein